MVAYIAHQRLLGSAPVSSQAAVAVIPLAPLLFPWKVSVLEILKLPAPCVRAAPATLHPLMPCRGGAIVTVADLASTADVYANFIGRFTATCGSGGWDVKVTQILVFL